MPITLEKLLSPTAETSFDFMGETVHVTFAPMRYTGEMQDFAERMSEEETAEQAAIAALRAEVDEILASAGKDKDGAAAIRAVEVSAEADRRERLLDLRDRKLLRDALATLLVSWDVMEGRKPLKTDLPTLNRLPDVFLRVVFLSLARENQPDPPRAPDSVEP